ncbi:MAG: PD40 domain-containing protein [Niabella sp.]|nr:PD40 domain-containing protein [Niabella sp.]
MKLIMRILFFVLAAAIFFSCKKTDIKDIKPNTPKDIKSNTPPIAIVRASKTSILPTDSITLDGSASNDPDGKISIWLWTKMGGAACTIVTPNGPVTKVKNLVSGTYEFQLSVTDNEGLVATDTVWIRVINPAPVARAGKDTSITLPANTAILDGRGSTDPENDITNYKWTKIEDGTSPASFNIVNPDAAQTSVTNLVEGTYQFELKVTDAGGLMSKDTVKVTVNPKPWTPPPCTANCGRIVFISGRDGNDEIYSCDSNGTNVIRLTNNPAADELPTWSPDGTRIAFISDRDGSTGLYTMNADGSNVVRLATTNMLSDPPTWSPDGTKIAYSASGAGNFSIWVVGTLPNGAAPTVLFGQGNKNYSPAWSPDGSRLAFLSDRVAYDFFEDIVLINADGSGLTNLTFDDNFDELAWSPDGTKLAFSEEGYLQQPEFIGVINADGTGKITIKSGNIVGFRPSWSADGSRILYTSMTGNRRDVSWITVDGSGSGTIITNGWSADWHH